MTVNPDEMLIFKLRGMRTPHKPYSTTQRVQARRATPSRREEVKQKRPVAERREIPRPKPEAPLIIPEEERRMREIENIEEMANLYTLSSKSLRPERPVNVFSRFTGTLFVLNAIVFGYFIHSQSAFVINYILQTGINAFFLNWNYDYGIATLNFLLVFASAASGLLMFTKFKKNHLVSGIIGGLLILATSSEYLNSNVTFLLIVSVIAFLSIVALAFTRMSAVRLAESEEPLPHEVPWPRLETF